MFSALKAVADWPRARFAAERMLESTGTAGDAASRRLRYVAQTFLAEALERDPENRNDLIRSEELLNDALSTTRALARELDTPEARRDVSVSLVQLSAIAGARGDTSRAVTLLKEARVVAKEFGSLQPLSDATDIIEAIDGVLNQFDAK